MNLLLVILSAEKHDRVLTEIRWNHFTWSGNSSAIEELKRNTDMKKILKITLISIGSALLFLIVAGFVAWFYLQAKFLNFEKNNAENKLKNVQYNFRIAPKPDLQCQITFIKAGCSIQHFQPCLSPHYHPKLPVTAKSSDCPLVWPFRISLHGRSLR